MITYMPAGMAHLAADAAISLLLLLLLPPHAFPRVVADSYDPVHTPEKQVGTRWAVLIAGSSGYGNYRHQADVCHAYQTLKKGGLKDEHIVVFMYDDIAYNKENPRPGIIINHPKGKDVYAGVPKDYVGDDVTVNNFFAVLLGNKSSLTGGSGKVVDSGPIDHIFVYYTDHGADGILAMPNPPDIFAVDLVNVLKTKHASKSYKALVFYVEACESGSIFQGLLPKGLNIYATTASNAQESSWATYCPGDIGLPPPPEYSTCLGDLYSVSWMEDSDTHDLRKRTLKQQYERVRKRTSNKRTYANGSHVMQYGDLNLNSQFLATYIGSGRRNIGSDTSIGSFPGAVNQRDADLVHFWNKFMRSTEGSSSKLDAQKQLVDVLSHRLHVDNSIELVGNFLFGSDEEGMKVLRTVRPAEQPVVDDWTCLKTMVRTFETYCGSLSQYGLKHMRPLANICNAGITPDMMIAASSQACKEFPSNPWSSLRKGFSA